MKKALVLFGSKSDEKIYNEAAKSLKKEKENSRDIKKNDVEKEKPGKIKTLDEF